MPQIPAYTDQITAQGVLTGQANPNDFGASIGVGMQRLGGSVNDVADALYQSEERKQVTDTHVTFFEARDKWVQELKNRANNAIPGDDTFVDTLDKDVADWTEKGMDSVTTPKARELYRNLSASLSSEIHGQAVAIQGKLAADDAKNKYVLVEKSAGSMVFNDHMQLDSVLAHGRALIDDPNSMFAKIPATTRDAFKADFEQSVNLAAAKGFVNKYPEITLQSMSPADLAKFNPWKVILDANKAPGARVDISPETLAKASEITAVSAAKGVNPNIAMAMMDLDAKDSKPKTDQTVVLAALVTKYGGDYSKAIAAADMGTQAFDVHLQRYGNDWENQLPVGVHAYLSTTLVKSGSVADPAAAPSVPESVVVSGTPVASTLPFLKNLSWENQDAIVREGIQAVNLKLTMAVRAREEQKYEVAKRQEAIMDGMLKQIWDPKGNGVLTEKDIFSDSTLDPQQKQHLIDYKMTRARELKFGAESRTNPGEVKRLMLMIHAPDGDPTKVYSMEPINESYRMGRISTNEYRAFQNEVTALKDGDGNNFQKSLYEATQKIEDTFKKDIAASMPGGMGVAADAAYRASFALREKVQEFRKAGKDPWVLITPGSKDYALAPEALASFMPSAMSIMKKQVQQMNQMKEGTISDSKKFIWQGGKWVPRYEAQTPGEMPTYKNYAALQPGTQFTDPDGKVRRKPDDAPVITPMPTSVVTPVATPAPKPGNAPVSTHVNPLVEAMKGIGEFITTSDKEYYAKHPKKGKP